MHPTQALWYTTVCLVKKHDSVYKASVQQGARETIFVFIDTIVFETADGLHDDTRRVTFAFDCLLFCKRCSLLLVPTLEA
jgi:hypothetical protein